MRNKRFWKIFGLSVSAVVILVLLFVVAFIFNPFEGSLPDMRDVVPRDVDHPRDRQRGADGQPGRGESLPE